ncbi:hypothetical protein ACE1B6_05440 [Aerosakkonemataceae cyanobacterium BLCC-F154]|uniref:Uncharacterized protein n=1 Tax=Floridaenema fluviatile BLCC-F154 TaxID=3153640 RepID=A0ABV4Y7C5_9CYAN
MTSIEVTRMILLGEITTISAISPYVFSLVGLGLIILVIYILNKNQVKAVQNMSEKALQIQGQVFEDMQEQTTNLSTMAKDKVNQVLEEYKRFLPYAEQLGLKVESFNIEAGVLPKIEMTLRGSIDAIKKETIERIKSENQNNQLLFAVLNAILLAKQWNDVLLDAYIDIFKDIVVDVKLGIPPSVGIRFQ